MLTSVIIPALNEKSTINSTIVNLIESASLKNLEIIVVDASPDDNKIETIDSACDVKVIKSRRGRARQMNLGAGIAKGEALIFIHADTILPHGWDKLVTGAIEKGYDGGGFLKRYDSPSALRRVNAFYSNIRTRVFGDLLGDNCIFVKKFVFHGIGGFKEIEIMEDVEFSGELKRYRRKIFRDKVITSSRRFERIGDLKTLCIFLQVRMLRLFKVDPRVIEALYDC